MLSFKLTLGPAQSVEHEARHANDTTAEILVDFREDEGATLGFLSCFCDIVSGKPTKWRVVGVNGGDIPGMTCFYDTKEDAMDAAYKRVETILN